jgi:hypothetical protein
MLQVACFARLLDDRTTIQELRRRFKEVILPKQMAADGGFPLELARTKPYGYSLFNLDVMSALAVVLSYSREDLMAFKLEDGRSMVRGVEFMAPFIADKSAWRRPPDVLYWKEWPVRHHALLFGAIAAGREDWLELWRRLPADPSSRKCGAIARFGFRRFGWHRRSTDVTSRATEIPSGDAGSICFTPLIRRTSGWR